VAETRTFLDDVAAGRDIDGLLRASRLQTLCALSDTAPEPVRMLIEAGADVNSRTREGRTPLMLASTADWRHIHGTNRPHNFAIGVVEALIEGGAEVDAKDDDGRTALSLCAQSGDAERIRVLVDAGADVNSGDVTGRTPLMWAPRSYDANVRALLEAGADPNLRDENGWTALVWMVRDAWGYPYTDTDVIKALLRAGADIDSEDDAGWTPVMHAAYAGSSYEPVEFLIESGASTGAAGWSDLTVFLLRRNVGWFEVTLRRGADVEARDAWGRTALMWSARFSWSRWHRMSGVTTHWNPTALLIEAGADLDARDDEGATALHIAAAHSGEATLSALIAAGADLEARDAMGRTPLLVSIEVPYYTWNVETLLRAGADPDARHPEGRTALMAATAQPDGDRVIEALLGAGADARLADHEGRTALDYAEASNTMREKRRAISLLRTALEDAGDG
ncbi:MAG: ankyrin repeat domain-containing protein, partial [Gemmatimonadetes bacterium]|nr:ankyrin repeat domain-containing protein [Gemmatimonadota bacterium]